MMKINEMMFRKSFKQTNPTLRTKLFSILTLNMEFC